MNTYDAGSADDFHASVTSKEVCGTHLAASPEVELPEPFSLGGLMAKLMAKVQNDKLQQNLCAQPGGAQNLVLCTQGLRMTI